MCQSGKIAQAVHGPVRSPHCYGKTGPFRPPAYEAHSVALKGKLACARVPRKNKSLFQSLSTSILSGECRKTCPLRPASTLVTACLLNLYCGIRCTLRCSFARVHSQGSLVHSRKQTPHQLSGIEGGSSGPETLLATDNTTVVAYINKEGVMKPGSLFALLWKLMSWCNLRNVILQARHIPG